MIDFRLNTGRPLAAGGRIEQQEAATGQALVPRNPGRKLKQADRQKEQVRCFRQS